MRCCWRSSRALGSRGPRNYRTKNGGREKGGGGGARDISSLQRPPKKGIPHRRQDPAAAPPPVSDPNRSACASCHAGGWRGRPRRGEMGWKSTRGVHPHPLNITTHPLPLPPRPNPQHKNKAVPLPPRRRRRGPGRRPVITPARSIPPGHGKGGQMHGGMGGGTAVSAGKSNQTTRSPPRMPTFNILG